MKGFGHGEAIYTPSLYQRNCVLENIRQEIYAKIGVMVSVYKQLWIPVWLFSRRWQSGVDFAFVWTPKSAVKSIRKTTTYIPYYYKFSALYNLHSLNFYRNRQISNQIKNTNKRVHKTRVMIIIILYCIIVSYYVA